MTNHQSLRTTLTNARTRRTISINGSDIVVITLDELDTIIRLTERMERVMEPGNMPQYEREEVTI